jgi:hypothetical protein
MFGNNLRTPEKFTIFIKVCEVPKYLKDICNVFKTIVARRKKNVE